MSINTDIYQAAYRALYNDEADKLAVEAWLNGPDTDQDGPRPSEADYKAAFVAWLQGSGGEQSLSFGGGTTAPFTRSSDPETVARDIARVAALGKAT